MKTRAAIHNTWAANISKYMSTHELPSVLWRCWLGGRKGIRPVKTEWWGAGVVICCSEVQTCSCIWPSWFHCHSLSLASVKSRLVLPYWYRLIWVVPEKTAVKRCVCVWTAKQNKCQNVEEMQRSRLVIVDFIQPAVFLKLPPGWARSYKRKVLGTIAAGFLQAICPSRHPTAQSMIGKKQKSWEKATLWHTVNHTKQDTNTQIKDWSRRHQTKHRTLSLVQPLQKGICKSGSI